MNRKIFQQCFNPILLQLWLLLIATPGTAVHQLENVNSPWMLKENIAMSLSSFLPTAAPIKNQSKYLNKKCVEDSRLVLKALLNRTDWAVSMFQASGKIPIDASTNYLISGAKGALNEPGLFDQCISTTTPSGNFQGQYCSAFISTIPVSTQPLLVNKNGPESYKQADDGWIFENPTMTGVTKKRNIFSQDNPADLIIGFCLPSSCSARDLQVAIGHLLEQPETYNLYSLATITTQECYCHTENKIQGQTSFDGLSISFLIVVCIIVGLVLTSTVYEIWIWQFPSSAKFHEKLNQEPMAMRILQCFSAVRNVKNWLSVKTAPVDEITCLHGLRVLTILATLFIHTSLVIFLLSLPTDQEKIVQLMSQWMWFPFTNGSVAMENCLLIGGILTCTSVLKDLNRGNFNLFRFFYHRYLRLTPLYSMVIFFVAALAGRLGSGPGWNIVQYQSEDCRNYWWSHLLYSNNIPPSDITFCMPDTWYSAVDMQLFLLSPLIIFPLWRWPKKIGPTLVLVWLSASIFHTMIIHLKWDIPLILMMTRASMRKQFPEYFNYYYTRTLNRIQPYLIGILLGWILNRTKNDKIQIQKGIVVLSWILSGITLAMIIYGPFPYADEKTAPVMNPTFELVYGAFHRTLWSAIIAWIIFLCFHEYGGKLNEFLSSKIFVLISRLSYSIYLVNFTLITAYVSYFRIPFNVNVVNIIIAYLGMLTFTLILSVFLSICIEMPFRNLEKKLSFSVILLVRPQLKRIQQKK